MHEIGDYLTVTPNKYGPETTVTSHGDYSEACNEASKECEHGTPSYVVEVKAVAHVALTDRKATRDDLHEIVDRMATQLRILHEKTSSSERKAAIAGLLDEYEKWLVGFTTIKKES